MFDVGSSMDKQSLTDLELAVLLYRDDKEAWSTLYYRHVQPLNLYIVRTTKSASIAEDIVQDVFLKLWENRHQIDPERPFKPFLYAIARNLMLNVLKRAQHEQFILEEIRKSSPVAEQTTDMQVQGNECNDLLNDAIDLLPAQCKEVFVRCRLEGMSYKEVAGELGITEGTVNSQMVKALKTIRRFILLRYLFLFFWIFMG